MIMIMYMCIYIYMYKFDNDVRSIDTQVFVCESSCANVHVCACAITRHETQNKQNGVATYCWWVSKCKYLYFLPFRGSCIINFLLFCCSCLLRLFLCSQCHILFLSFDRRRFLRAFIVYIHVYTRTNSDGQTKCRYNVLLLLFGLLFGFLCACIHHKYAVYDYKYMHSYTGTYIHTYMHACMRVCIHVFIYTNIQTYKLTYIHTCIYTHIRINKQTYGKTYLYLFTISSRYILNFFIHTYIHTCMGILTQLGWETSVFKRHTSVFIFSAAAVKKSPFGEAHTHANTCTHTQTYTRTHTCVCTNAHLCARKHAHTHIHNMHTPTHTHAHTHSNTHTTAIFFLKAAASSTFFLLFAAWMSSFCFW